VRPDAVATALEAAGERTSSCSGPASPGSGIEEGLLDEVLVHVMPVLLGDGVRPFASADAAPVRLETVSVAESGPLTDLRFIVVKERS
jgi:hypothetical protein